MRERERERDWSIKKVSVHVHTIDLFRTVLRFLCSYFYVFGSGRGNVYTFLAYSARGFGLDSCREENNM